MTAAWGILQPSDIPSARRLQSLGLTRAIRRFNEKAVPGMGGLWFAMPLIWSMIGIRVSRQLERGVGPIRSANAVEALAMKLALEDGDEEEIQRIRIKGRRNLALVGKSFEDLCKPGAYVTQPFRQTCTQPLLTLGLVGGTSGRFSSFHLTDQGERLLAPFEAIRSEIEAWVGGSKRNNWDALSAILPTAGIPDGVCKDLTQLIYGDGAEAERRKAIRDVGGQLTSDGVLDGSANGLTQDHLIDLRGGIAIVRLRLAALQVLSAVEDVIAKRRDYGLPQELSLGEAGLDDRISIRISACVAEALQAAAHIEAAGEAESGAFLRDCRTADGLLQRLARRDGVVIVLRDDVLVRGPAFGADAVAEEDFAPTASGVPELPRIANLLGLTAELSKPNSYTFRVRAAE